MQIALLNTIQSCISVPSKQPLQHGILTTIKASETPKKVAVGLFSFIKNVPDNQGRDGMHVTMQLRVELVDEATPLGWIFKYPSRFIKVENYPIYFVLSLYQIYLLCNILSILL